MYQVFHTFIVKLILIKNIFSFLWIHGVAHDHFLRALNCTSEWRIVSKVIVRFDIDATSSWWRSLTRKARLRFEFEPLWIWYYCISSNFHTLVIVLQVDPTSGDEPETVCEGCYETENISIFTWSSIPGIGYYRWLCGLIYWLPFNNKTDYLVRTIWQILDFLQLWIIIMA
jgi:hypothetical protein